MEINVKELIAASGKKLDDERKSIRENSGWMVQYLPCGHVAELAHNNPLVEKAKTSKYIDALVRPQRECPLCNDDVDRSLFARICEP